MQAVDPAMPYRPRKALTQLLSDVCCPTNVVPFTCTIAEDLISLALVLRPKASAASLPTASDLNFRSWSQIQQDIAR